MPPRPDPDETLGIDGVLHATVLTPAEAAGLGEEADVLVLHPLHGFTVGLRPAYRARWLGTPPARPYDAPTQLQLGGDGRRHKRRKLTSDTPDSQSYTPSERERERDERNAAEAERVPRALAKVYESYIRAAAHRPHSCWWSHAAQEPQSAQHAESESQSGFDWRGDVSVLRVRGEGLRHSYGQNDSPTAAAFSLTGPTGSTHVGGEAQEGFPLELGVLNATDTAREAQVLAHGSSDTAATHTVVLPPRSGFYIADLLTPLREMQEAAQRGRKNLFDVGACCGSSALNGLSTATADGVLTRPNPKVKAHSGPDIIYADPPYPNLSAERLSAKKQRLASTSASAPDSAQGHANHYATVEDLYDLWQLKPMLQALLRAAAASKVAPKRTLVAFWVTNDPKARSFVVDKLFPSLGIYYAGEWQWCKVTTGGDAAAAGEETAADRRATPQLVVGYENARRRKPTETLLLGWAGVKGPLRPALRLKPKIIISVPSGHSRKPYILSELARLHLVHEQSSLLDSAPCRSSRADPAVAAARSRIRGTSLPAPALRRALCA